MKITKIEAIPMGVHLKEPLQWGEMIVDIKGGIVVLIHTDSDLVGIGEAGMSAVYYPTVGPIILEEIAPLIVGEDPTMIGHLWNKMYKETHKWGRRGVQSYALSGVDIALWDLFGKMTNLPIYKLLGGNKKSIRAYAAPDLKKKERIVKDCMKLIEKSFTAIKLRAGLGIEEDKALIKSVRKAVGDNVDLMVDPNMAYDRRTALYMGKFFEDENIIWMEEPILANSLDQYIQDHEWLSERVNIKLSGGECLFTRYEFSQMLPRKIFDIVQPDTTSVGGISEAKRIADMASVWNLAYAPHVACSSGTSINMTASMHVSLSCPNALILEHDAYGGPGWDGLLVETMKLEDGYLHVLDKPGLGVELAPDAIKRFSLIDKF